VGKKNKIPQKTPPLKKGGVVHLYRVILNLENKNLENK